LARLWGPGFRRAYLRRGDQRFGEPRIQPVRAAADRVGAWGLLERAVDYRRTFRHLEIFYIPKAGHYVQLEQPELMHRVLRAFLLDQPDAIPSSTCDTDLGQRPHQRVKISLHVVPDPPDHLMPVVDGDGNEDLLRFRHTALESR
jgi:hypothetical protein